jgi:hypothetical protein
LVQGFLRTAQPLNLANTGQCQWQGDIVLRRRPIHQIWLLKDNAGNI